MTIHRLFDILDYQQKTFPQETAFSFKVDNTWVKYSTDKIIELSNQTSYALLNAGVRPKDKIGIVSNSRPEWNIVDFGIQQVGAVSVPIYPTITETDMSYILEDASVSVVFVGSKDLLEKVQNASRTLNIKIISFDKLEGVTYFRDFIDCSANPEELKDLKDKVMSTDLATLIYTSGTTGKPKGVMLSHKNILSNVTACTPLLPLDETDKTLSFLPLCHVFERMLIYLYMNKGVSIYYAESLETIGDNLKELKPDFFTCVPRLLEKVYDKIYAKGKELTGIKRALFFWSIKLGFKYKLGQKNAGWL